MSSHHSFWYRLGYALERARRPPPTRLERLRERARAARERRSPPRPEVEDAVATAALALAGRLLASPDGRRGGVLPLLRGALAGAGASVLLELVRPLLDAGGDAAGAGGPAERIAAGAAHGAVYGAVGSRYLPGGPLVRGALYGAADYLLVPAGGLPRLLGRRTPLARVPLLLRLLDELEGHERSFVETVTFGVALALLYGPPPASRGIRGEDGS